MAQSPAKRVRKELPVLRVGGVPEHFNYPWHHAMEEGGFQAHGVQVEWVEQKLGTGAMIKALKAKEVDMVVALTEGLVADIAQGSDLVLVSTYVESPLCWAISVGAKSPVQSVEDLRGQTWAISRFTSGSHLMAIVLASQRGWDPEKELQFVEKGNIQNLLNAVNEEKAPSAAFMWETFTTKPYHDSGVVRRVGDITTPWPCFLIATTRSFLQDNHQAVQACLTALQESCEMFAREKETMPGVIASRYELEPTDAKKWYEGVRITASQSISDTAIRRTLAALREGHILPELKAGEKELDASVFVGAPIAHVEHDVQGILIYDKPTLIRYLYGELKERQISGGPVSYKALLSLDQHHYHLREKGGDPTSVPSVDLCAHMLGLKPVEADAVNAAGPSCSNCSNVNRSGAKFCDQCGSAVVQGSRPSIINFGATFGGPARYLAGKYGCQLIAVELQDELHNAASELTRRCEPEVADNVKHLCGDIMAWADLLRTDYYDAIVSWLTVLHIPDRRELLHKCFSLLKPGGYFYAEDFYARAVLTEEEQAALKDLVFSQSCTSLPHYRSDLEAAGFIIKSCDDVTDTWTNYTQRRAEQWESAKVRNVRVHGVDIEGRLSNFYGSIRTVFRNGRVGGVRWLAQKPHKPL